MLDPDAAAAHTHARGLVYTSLAELAADSGIRQAVAAAVDEANSHLSRVEQIERFAILPGDWTPLTGELTPTLKLKRRVITQKYADQIEAMYGGSVDGGAPVVAPWRPPNENASLMSATRNPRGTRTGRLAQLLMNLLIEAGRGTLMLAPVIVAPEDDRER